MRAITRISLALILSLFAGGALWAQTSDQSAAPPTAPPYGKMGGMRGQHRGFDRMAQELNLTDQQKTQIQGVFQTQRQQMQSIRQDTSLTPEQRQEKMRQLRDSTHQQIMGVLTPEQQQKWQQMPHARQGMGGPGGPGSAMGPFSRLNLTEDQKTKIQPIMESSRQQVQAVRSDTSLTPQQKQAKIREIHQSTKSQIDALLTPEQKQELQQMRHHRGRRGGYGPPPGSF